MYDCFFLTRWQHRHDKAVNRKVNMAVPGMEIPKERAIFALQSLEQVATGGGVSEQYDPLTVTVTGWAHPVGTGVGEMDGCVKPLVC